MSLSFRWVNESERDRVGEIRALCYGRSQNEIPDAVEHVRAEKDFKSEYLVAERDGVAIGTSTSIPMTMWMRGGSVPCDGVAWVGTVRTQRRRAGSDPGVGTAIMNESLRRARERGDVVSALMPFRGSYYEHFGYGFVERRTEWTVPLSIMPRGEFDTIRFFDAAKDRAALEQCRQRIAQRGQCDIERSPARWDRYLQAAANGFLIIDRHADGPARGWMTFEHIPSTPAGPDTVKTWWDTGYEDVATLKRFLYFLGSLRDQYSNATIQLPADLPLNLLLKEAQMTHRTARNHPTSEMRPFNRMQVRVLDHLKLLAAMRLPQADRREGQATVAIVEPEGSTTKLTIEIAPDGKIAAAATQSSADVEMSTGVWSMIVCGNLPASRAAELGLISVANRTPLRVLEALSDGPIPYCREYF